MATKQPFTARAHQFFGESCDSLEYGLDIMIPAERGGDRVNHSAHLHPCDIALLKAGVAETLTVWRDISEVPEFSDIQPQITVIPENSAEVDIIRRQSQDFRGLVLQSVGAVLARHRGLGEGLTGRQQAKLLEKASVSFFYNAESPVARSLAQGELPGLESAMLILETLNEAFLDADYAVRNAKPGIVRRAIQALAALGVPGRLAR